MKLLVLPFLMIIRFWQKFIAPGMAPRCKYYPSCSAYTYEAIQRFNLVGLFLGAWRIIRCNPFSHGGLDKVPTSLQIGPIKIGKASITA
jgi:putative membrane protein insertion efficiency factor